MGARDKAIKAIEKELERYSKAKEYIHSSRWIYGYVDGLEFALKALKENENAK